MSAGSVVFVPFACLFAALCLLALRPASVVPVAGLLAAAMVAAVAAGVLDAVGVLICTVYLALGAVLLRGQSPDYVRWLCWPVLGAMSIALAAHAVPGFSNPLVVDSTIVSEGAPAISLYWNLDKGLVAITLFALWQQRIGDPGQSAQGRLSFVVAVATVALVFCLGVVVGVVKLDPKLPAFFPRWAVSNLLITCVAEEAFFRGLLLGGLARVLPFTRGVALAFALSLSSVLFGVAHVAGGTELVLFATLAGLGYGLVYVVSGRLEYSILAHFLLNAVHMLLFSYPMLQSADGALAMSP